MAESPASGLTDPKRNWLQKALGVVSEAVNGPPQAGFKDPSIPPPLPKLTGDEAAADLQRRLAKAGPTYEQLGKPGGDAAFSPGNQLSGPETRLGQTIVETNQSVTTTKPDGTTTRVDTGVNGAPSTTTFDERGITIQQKSSVSTTWLGDNGKANEFTIDRLDSTNIGMGNVTVRKGDRVTDNDGDKTTITSKLDSAALDLAKGDVSTGNIKSVETRDDKGVTTEKKTKKTSEAVGLNGYTTSTEKSVQTDKTLSSTGSVINVGRSPGMLGVTGTFTDRNNEISGKGENAAVGAGTEDKTKATAGLVSDAKGTGLGASVAKTEKTTNAAGRSLENTQSAGGKFQSIVKEIPGSDPPRFTIQTTISFDLAIGKTAGYDTPGTKQIGRDGDDGGERPGGGRVGASIGGSAQGSASASFKHELDYDEAKQYLDYVKDNGRGSKLPEHMILASGLKDGWVAAKALWNELSGSPDRARQLKPGEEIETSRSVTLSGKAGINAAEKPVGGIAIGVELSGAMSDTFTIKKTGTPEGLVQVTVTVEDSKSAGITGSAAYGAVSGSHGETRGAGKGRAYVFSLDPEKKTFDAQLKAIESADSIEALALLADDPAFKVTSRTDKTSDSAGSSDTLGVAGVSVGLATSKKLDAETTTDATGAVTGSKVTGTNTQTLSAGLGTDSKLTMTDSESFTGQVKGNEASGELARSHGESNLAKSVTNALLNPLGVALNPGKTAVEKVDTQGTSFNDAELMSICALALDKGKWNSQVGGRAQKDWIETGAAIRSATSQGDDGKLTYDRHIVTRALAEFTRNGDGDRTKILERVYRPLLGGGDETPKGKAFAIPDTLEYLKLDWDTLVANNPLPAALDKLAKDPKAGLEDLNGLIKRLKTLRDTVKKESAKFEGMEIQQAEMLGHINSRLKDVSKALKSAQKSLPKPDAAPPTEDEAIVARAQEKFAALDEYLDNVSQLEKYKKTLFGKLWQAEEKLKETSFMGGNKVEEAMPLIYQTADMLKLWDKLYDETDAMRKKLPQQSKDLETELRELHPKGGHDRWNEVNKAAHKY